MKAFVDRQKVNARASAANAASVGGLLLLLGSLLLPYIFPRTAAFSLLLLAAGGMLAMVGIYLANRWVRKPRPEDSLAKALKSFDDQYRLFHYPARCPSEHVLLTPSGVIGLEVVNLAGSFAYRKGRWREAMTMGRALRYLVEPRVVDPSLLATGMGADLKLWIDRHVPERAKVPLKVLTVFTHPGVFLEIDRGGFPACTIDKLRKQVNLGGGKLTAAHYEALAAALEEATLG
jgi:hypothetical protein